MRIKTSRTFGKRIMVLLLAFLLAWSPCSPFWQGNSYAQDGRFQIDIKKKGNMLNGEAFLFFGKTSRTGIYYWMKDDGSPLLCVQKNAQLIWDLNGEEISEEITVGKHFDRKEYELTSLVLQCCGMRKEETAVLEPGEYMAAQAAVWGILSDRWQGTAQLREEMENLYQYVADWNQVPAAELIGQSRAMIERICQAIDDYYGNSSIYLPEFASKYKDKVPVWQAEWQSDGTCQAVFSLGERSEAVKDFVFELPEGWQYEWQGGQVTFWAENPETSDFLVTGLAPEGSRLEDAMPIGLIYIAYPADYTSLQHLASAVELTVPWSCYFKLSVPENPGSWLLPEVRHYRHQEDFTALYGAGLEKQDRDTGELLAGVRFQPLEYFDDSQLEDSVLDKRQFEQWNGWKARCGEEVTDSEGHLVHWDEKCYHYEKTYCSGHPEPEIVYEGSSQEEFDKLEEESLAAWEAEVEACAQICDYHTLDGSGEALLEADRDLAYQQFINLTYGYAFEETKPADGYRLPEGDEKRTEPVFCVSAQAGGRSWTEMGLERSVFLPERVQASASGSDAGRETASGSTAGRKDTESKASRSSARKMQRRLGRHLAPNWLTSLLAPLEQETAEHPDFYLFQVENEKETPEETEPPEET
ncbi:MAG: hypothetical protein Q4F29_13095, partial [Lachnospiraceae bacterium]|nr:hypothetical protein [Lachnospiraceae bacterium]